MAGRPIEIPITVDADADGASKIVDAFDDIEDSLKDAGKTGDKAGKQIEDGMSDAARKIHRDLTGALRDVADEAKTTGRTVGREIKDGTDKAGEGFDDMKSEAASTAKETAASFGSIEDAAGALQEVAANAFAAFGPAGLAAGLLAAAGIGLAMSALTDNAEKINENKENMLGFAAEIRDAGGDLSKVDFVGRMQDWGLAIQDTKEWFEVFQDDAKSGFEVVKEKSRDAGTSWTEAFKGAQGTMEDSLRFLKETEGQYNSLNTEIDVAGATVDDFGRANSMASAETMKQRDALIEQREAAQKNADATRDANKAAWDAINVGKTQNSVLQEQLALTNDLADSKKDARTAALDLADAQDEAREKLEASTAAYGDGSKAARENERTIIDSVTAINDWGQAQVDSGASVDATNSKMDAQKAQLLDVATKFFGSREAAETYIASLAKTPKRIDTDVNLNGIPDAEEKIRQFTAKGRHLSVDVTTGDVSAVDNYIRNKQGTKIYVDIAPRGGVGITN